MKNIQIRFPADFKFVPGVRTCVSKIAYNFGFDDREVYQIETIVDEICNNAIEHGAEGEEDSIFVECVFENDAIELTVKDSGHKDFNIEEVFARAEEMLKNEKFLKDILQRGRGLLIVKRLADKIEVKVDESGHVVRIIKRKRLEKE